MKQTLTKLWLSCWLYVITLISGIILGVTAAKWNVWDLQTKIFAFATALLPIHVLEEWRFPGGFHTMYNLMAGSEDVDRYPMNQLSDMWTNFIGVIFGCIVLSVGVNPFFAVMQLFLCAAEMFGHTNGGIFAYKKFRNAGKKTIYNPGLFTTVFGYLPVTIGLIVSFFKEQAPTWWQAVLAILCGMALGAFSLQGMEKICKDENSPYGYTWGNGYFERYLKLK